jgi:hypothetical protein
MNLKFFEIKKSYFYYSAAVQSLAGFAALAGAAEPN